MTVHDLYVDNPYFSVILSSLQAEEQSELYLHDRFIFRGNQLYVPDYSLRLFIIQELHNEVHVGRDKTINLISRSYFWPSMRKDVYRFVEGCRIYQVSKSTTTNVGLYTPLSIPTQP